MVPGFLALAGPIKAGLGGLLGAGVGSLASRDPLPHQRLDPEAYKYQGASNQDLRGIGEASQNRAGVRADYDIAQQYGMMGLQSRGDQRDALGLYREAALGRGPSAAQAQYQQAIDQQRAQAASMGASARGTGPQRAALQAMAMQQAGLAGQQSAAGSAALRAQEMQAAMQGYGGMAGQIRGQDLQGMQQQAQMSQYQAQLEDSQRARNDQRQMGYEQLAMNAENARREAQMRLQENQANLNMAVNAANSDISYQNRVMPIKAALAGVQAFGGMQGMSGGGGGTTPTAGAPAPIQQSSRYPNMPDPGY